MIPKQPHKFKLLHIASDHIDLMCLRCRTAFDVKEHETINCPFCDKEYEV